MTVPGPGPATDADADADAAERRLLLRVLSTLIREDVLGWRTRGTLEHRPDGLWLRLAAADGRAFLLPVCEDGFQSEFAARSPLLRVEPDGRELTTGQDVLSTLTALAEPADQGGFTAFAAEYNDALAALRLHAATHDQVMALLVSRHGADCARWQGPAASLAFDALAARVGHPLYPTDAARTGVPSDRLLGYAPEFAPRFALRWLAVPRESATVQGFDIDGYPGTYWPRPSDLGLAGLDATHLTLPVHPLTADGPLRDVLAETGLQTGAVLADRPLLEVAPTLSMRTVALTAYPCTHLKMPLATSTLGLRNRRTIKPGTLEDGAAAQRLLAAVMAREPRFRGRILHMDEACYAQAGNEYLAVLVRRHPTGLEGTTVLPLAALLAPAPDGRMVIEHLADRWFAGDLLLIFQAILSLLLDWHVTLFGYGIALESHQQNISLLIDEAGHAPGGPARIRLLYKDEDSPRINRIRLRAAFGPDGRSLVRSRQRAGRERSRCGRP